MAGMISGLTTIVRTLFATDGDRTVARCSAAHAEQNGIGAAEIRYGRIQAFAPADRRRGLGRNALLYLDLFRGRLATMTREIRGHDRLLGAPRSSSWYGCCARPPSAQNWAGLPSSFA